MQEILVGNLHDLNSLLNTAQVPHIIVPETL